MPKNNLKKIADCFTANSDASSLCRQHSSVRFLFAPLTQTIFFKILSNILFTLFLFFPGSVNGQIIINEIMYDLPGSDSGREWIEIYNSGSEEINLEGFNLETTANHRPFSLISKSFVLPAGGFALIVQNYDKFKKDWPNLNRTIFKSSFSLNNTAGRIALKNQDEILDEVNYSSALGVKGNGENLQKFGENWLNSLPTPGQTNKVSYAQTPSSDSKESKDKSAEPVSSANSLEEVQSNKSLKRTKENYGEIDIKNEGKIAGAFKAESQQESRNLNIWLLALAGLLLLSSLPIIFAPKIKPKPEPNLAEGIKIIEDKEDE